MDLTRRKLIYKMRIFLELLGQLRSREVKGGDVQPLRAPVRRDRTQETVALSQSAEKRGVREGGRKRQHVPKFLKAGYGAAGPLRATGSPGHRGGPAHPESSCPWALTRCGQK